MMCSRLLRVFGCVLAAGCSPVPPVPGIAPPDVSPPRDTSTVLTRPVLTVQASGTSALLQAVSVVDSHVVWVSGHAGTYARTRDGGETWEARRVPGADTLQFRDVHATGPDTAWLMSAGNGELSRIYRTTDGGASWTLQHLDRDPDVFFDCMAFWDARRGVVFSDAVRGEHVILRTTDAGATWTRVPADRMPRALPGEGSFAASGTCVATHAPSHAWVGTGNAATARALRTSDGGASWTSFTLPVVAGTGAGIASTIFRDTLHGVVLGGDIGNPAARGDYVALTRDGGRSWTLGGRPTFAGAVYGAAYVPGVAAPTIIAVGPAGADVSRDEGRSWTRLDTRAYWSVGFASPRDGWLVGPGGRIVKVSLF